MTKRDVKEKWGKRQTASGKFGSSLVENESGSRRHRLKAYLVGCRLNRLARRDSVDSSGQVCAVFWHRTEARGNFGFHPDAAHRAACPDSGYKTRPIRPFQDNAP